MKRVFGLENTTQVFLRDADNNTITDIEGLKVDKYYFKNVKKYNKADDLSDATAISLGNDLSQVFGEAGTYHSEQVIQSGIYGYRVYGDVNGHALDVTLFCAADGMDDPTKFEDTGDGEPAREFGCPRDIDDIKFPADKKNKHNDDD